MLSTVVALTLAVASADEPMFGPPAPDQLGRDRLAPVDFLLPEYERALAQALPRERGRLLLEMDERPSFSPEQRVAIVRRNRRYDVVAIRAKSNVWYRAVGETPGTADTPPERCISPVTATTVEKIRAVWAAALDSAGPSENTGLDGTSFYFTLVGRGGSRTGYAWSPERGTKLERLVDLGQGLVSLACADRQGRRAAEARLAAAADALRWWFEADRIVEKAKAPPPRPRRR